MIILDTTQPVATNLDDYFKVQSLLYTKFAFKSKYKAKQFSRF